MTSITQAALTLTVEEKLELIADVWESLEERGDLNMLTPDQERELDQRIDQIRSTKFYNWSEVVTSIRNSL